MSRRYKLFGQVLESEVEFDGILWSSCDPPSLKIRLLPLSKLNRSVSLREIHPVINGSRSHRISVHKAEDRIRITCHGVAIYELFTNEIHVFTTARTKLSDVKSRLLGPVISLWLERTNLLVLHASSVLHVDNGAVLFVGHSGMGKSTLAAAMMYSGWEFLNDDLVPVRLVSNHESIAFHGPPFIRLRDDQVKHFNMVESQHLQLMNKHKNTVSLKNLINQPKSDHSSIARIYVIESHDDDPPLVIEQIPLGEALISLIQCSYAALVLERLGMQHRRFSRLAKMLQTVSVRKIRLRQRFTDYEFISRTVFEDMHFKS